MGYSVQVQFSQRVGCTKVQDVIGYSVLQDSGMYEVGCAMAMSYR